MRAMGKSPFDQLRWEGNRVFVDDTAYGFDERTDPAFRADRELLSRLVRELVEATGTARVGAVRSLIVFGRVRRRPARAHPDTAAGKLLSWRLHLPPSVSWTPGWRRGIVVKIAER